jgi:hypothetical protein
VLQSGMTVRGWRWLAAIAVAAFALFALARGTADAYTYDFDDVIHDITSCPYTYTDQDFASTDWRNPWFRWDTDTAHSTGVRWIRTTGAAASDYADIAAHDQSYHQPPNGYLAVDWHFNARIYSIYGSCSNGSPTYSDPATHYGYVRA